MPCNEFGALYVQATGEREVAIGCRDAFAIGQIALRLYEPIELELGTLATEVTRDGDEITMGSTRLLFVNRGDNMALNRVTIAPGQRALVGSGLALQIPPGYEGQVRPRSGLALRHRQA